MIFNKRWVVVMNIGNNNVFTHNSLFNQVITNINVC